MAESSSTDSDNNKAEVTSLSKPALPPWQKYSLAALLVAAVMVLFVLPRQVDSPWVTIDEETPVIDQDASPADTPYSQARKAQFRRDAQDLLATILKRREQLEARSVSRWGEAGFRNAHSLATDGDTAYQQARYEDARNLYTESLAILDQLLEQAEVTLKSALERGSNALARGDQATAGEAFSLAKAIDPSNAAADAGLARTKTLPEVNRLFEEGNDFLARGKLEEAVTRYEQAAKLDAEDKRVSARLASTRQTIADNRFRAIMGEGYEALSRSDFSAAEAAFRRAASAEPGHPEVTRALKQVRERRSQLAVNVLFDRAEQYEAAEQWSDAVATYKAILAKDPSVTQARVSNIKASARAALDAGLQGYIEEPLNLTNNATHRAASELLAEARGIRQPGPRLQHQIAALEQALKFARQTVNVAFRSDNATEVTLLRVRRLGQFQQKSLILKPGNYVAHGTKPGFRDVRVEFTVTGEPLSGPIVVQCTEPIL